jgi:hypothetical protein
VFRSNICSALSIMADTISVKSDRSHDSHYSRDSRGSNDHDGFRRVSMVPSVRQWKMTSAHLSQVRVVKQSNTGIVMHMAKGSVAMLTPPPASLAPSESIQDFVIVSKGTNIRLNATFAVENIHEAPLDVPGMVVCFISSSFTDPSGRTSSEFTRLSLSEHAIRHRWHTKAPCDIVHYGIRIHAFMDMEIHFHHFSLETDHNPTQAVVSRQNIIRPPHTTKQ